MTILGDALNTIGEGLSDLTEFTGGVAESAGSLLDSTGNLLGRVGQNLARLQGLNADAGFVGNEQQIARAAANSQSFVPSSFNTQNALLVGGLVVGVVGLISLLRR